MPQIAYETRLWQIDRQTNIVTYRAAITAKKTASAAFIISAPIVIVKVIFSQWFGKQNQLVGLEMSLSVGN